MNYNYELYKLKAFFVKYSEIILDTIYNYKNCYINSAEILCK